MVAQQTIHYKRSLACIKWKMPCYIGVYCGKMTLAPLIFSNDILLTQQLLSDYKCWRYTRYSNKVFRTIFNVM